MSALSALGGRACVCVRAGSGANDVVVDALVAHWKAAFLAKCKLVRRCDAHRGVACDTHAL
jgi:hypothetical protein